MVLICLNTLIMIGYIRTIRIYLCFIQFQTHGADCECIRGSILVGQVGKCTEDGYGCQKYRTHRQEPCLVFAFHLGFLLIKMYIGSLSTLSSLRVAGLFKLALLFSSASFSFLYPHRRRTGQAGIPAEAGAHRQKSQCMYRAGSGYNRLHSPALEC